MRESEDNMGNRLYRLELDSREAAALRVLLKNAFVRDTEFIANAQKALPVFPGAQSFIDAAEVNRTLYNKAYKALCHYEQLPDPVTQPEAPAPADAAEECVTSSDSEPEAEEELVPCCGTCQHAVSGELPAEYSCTNPASSFGCDFVDADEFCEEWVERLPEAVEKQCSTCRFSCPHPSYGYLCINSACAYCGYPVGRESSQNVNCTSWVPRSESQTMEDTIAPIIAQDVGMDKLPPENKTERRFYVVKSSLYGVTVYDRTIQAPAFAQGAESGMSDVRAVMLSCRLNRMDREGQILS